MGSDVDLIFGADTKKARAEMAKLRKDMSRIIEKNKKLEKASSKSNSKQVKGLSAITSAAGSAVAGIGGIAGAYKLVSSQIAGVIEQTKLLNAARQDATLTFDEAQTRLLVQGGFKRGGKEDEFLRKKAFGLGSLLGTRATDIQTGLTEFFSSGGTLKQINGGVFEEIARLGKASNITDLGGLTKQILSAITQRGTAVEDVTGKQIRDTAIKIVNLFGKATFQSSDLKSLAESTAVAKKFGVDQDEQFALFSVLKNVLGEKSDKSGERLKILLREAAKFGEDKNKQKALKKIKLNPKDLKGKPITERLEIIGSALNAANLDSDQQLDITSVLFGGEAGVDILGLIGQIDKVKKRKLGLNDPTRLRQGVRTGSGGSVAAQNRIENIKLQQGSASRTRSGITVAQQYELIKTGIQSEVDNNIIGPNLAAAILSRIESASGFGEAFFDTEGTLRSVLALSTFGSDKFKNHLEIGNRIVNSFRISREHVARKSAFDEDVIKTLKDKEQRDKNNTSVIKTSDKVDKL